MSDSNKAALLHQHVMIDYTNHAGMRTIRQIVPMLQERSFRFGSTEWHPETQYLLDAYDIQKDDLRTFAVKDIHSWSPANSASGRSMASYAKQLQASMERNARMVNRLKKLKAECDDFEPRKCVIDDIDAILRDEDF